MTRIPMILDRALCSIEELNPKDRFDRWENSSDLSTTPESYVEATWDCIIPYPLRSLTFPNDIHSR